MSERTDIYGQEHPELSDSELYLLREHQKQHELQLQLVPVTSTSEPTKYEDPATRAAVLAALRAGESYDILPDVPGQGKKKPSKKTVRPEVLCPGADWDHSAQDWLMLLFTMPVVGRC